MLSGLLSIIFVIDPHSSSRQSSSPSGHPYSMSRCNSSSSREIQVSGSSREGTPIKEENEISYCQESRELVNSLCVCVCVLENCHYLVLHILCKFKLQNVTLENVFGDFIGGFVDNSVMRPFIFDTHACTPMHREVFLNIRLKTYPTFRLCNVHTQSKLL